MAMKAPYFETPDGFTQVDRNNARVSGRGESRTNISICIANHGHELASVFCDENGHFSATLNLAGVGSGNLPITARSVLSNSTSDWGPNLTIIVK